jgi:two-component system sensor histidine kinase ChvG
VKRFSIGLRGKIIFLSSFLLILPWLGYNYVSEMDNFLRQGQQQTLIGTTRAVATALHERPTLFNAQASFLPEVQAGKDLYAYDIKQAIQLDGVLTDWQHNKEQRFFYGAEYVRFQAQKYQDNPISFTHMVGKKEGYLYGYFQVTDKYPVFRSTNARQLDKNDHLVIALTSAQGILQHYIISVHKSGWFNAFLKPDNDNELGKLAREKRIQGYWQQTNVGYNIEFRLPLTMLGNKLGFALYTVSDKKNRQITNIIATSNIQDATQLGTVLIPSPEIEQILKGMSHTQSRIWVVDRHQRVLAKVGDILHADGAWPADNSLPEKPSWWDKFHNALLAPLYALVLSPPINDFNDDLKDSTQLNSAFIEQALAGKSQSNWSLSSDGKAMILSAATPILVGDKVMGMVVAQETTNGIRTLRNKALEKLFNIMLALIFIATLVQFIFASHIVFRIRRLRDQTDNAIDSQGRILTPFIAAQSGDEIGDLSRGLFDMVSRLGQYHHYLENLAARLSHELRTPVAVVRSSLENLAFLPQNSDNKKYIERAENGLNRLNRILTSMSEASRIEQSLQSCEKAIFPLNGLLEGCIQGYQMTYSAYHFLFTQADQPLLVDAEPDLIVQLLDKLINNALEFSEQANAIVVSLEQLGNDAVITVANIGPLLPEKMGDQLLNSMVSVRSSSQQTEPHLGLGLFIAKIITQFHQGEIRIQNRTDNLGVQVEVHLPMASRANR